VNIPKKSQYEGTRFNPTDIRIRANERKLMMCKNERNFCFPK